MRPLTVSFYRVPSIGSLVKSFIYSLYIGMITNLSPLKIDGSN